MGNFARKTLFVLLFGFLTFLSHGQNQGNQLIGSWLGGEDVGYQGFHFTARQIFEFELDDEWIDFDDYGTSYVVRGNSIYIEGEKWVSFRFNGRNTLILTEDDYEMVFSRLDNATSLSGIFYNENGVGLFDSIEFIDHRRLRIESISIMGFSSSLVYEYEISGSNLIIRDNRGVMVLDIIGDRLIVGNTMGFGNSITVFVKDE